MTEPRVSVLVCAIAGADHLARCLELVLAQEGPAPFEILAVADPNLPGVAELAPRFSWVLPGHGRIHQAPPAEMQKALDALLAWMRTV